MYPINDVESLSRSIDLQPQPVPAKLKFSVWHTFKHHIPRFLTTIIIDVILPLAIYIIFQRHMKPVYALLAASSPPLFMVIFKAVWLWTFDALGFLVFFSFVITAVVAIISRNPLIILLEKSLITGVLSLIFGVTLIPFQCCKHRCRWRPLAYYFYQDLVPTTRTDIGLPDEIFNEQPEQVGVNYAHLQDEVVVEKLSQKKEVAQVYGWIYHSCSSFRLSCYIITSVWSIGYLSEFIIRFTMILVGLSVNKIVIYGHIILSSITVLMIVLTIICITIERRYTLAFIEQWRIEYFNLQQKNSAATDASLIMINLDSDSVLNIDT